MIITLSGRIGSGKSELAKICKKQNMILLKSADGLKDLICNILEKTKEELEYSKNTLINKILSCEDIKYISQTTNIDYGICLILLNNKLFSTVRKLLIYLGTDLIRKHNQNWHINQVINKIKLNPDLVYCIDDIRFKSELVELSQFENVHSFFIIRPNNQEYINHSSETELQWFYFPKDKIIVNDGDKEQFVNSWTKKIITKCFDSDYCKEFASLAFTSINPYIAGLLTYNCAVEIIKGKTTVVFSHENYRTFSAVYNHILSSYKLENEFSYLRHLTYFNGKCVFESSNPFLIENLKLLNIKNRNDKNYTVPYFISDDSKLAPQWVCGLIEGSAITKEKSIILTCSLEIKDYLIQQLPENVSPIWELGVNELFEVKWLGEKYKNLYQWIK